MAAALLSLLVLGAGSSARAAGLKKTINYHFTEGYRGTSGTVGVWLPSPLTYPDTGYLVFTRDMVDGTQRHYSRTLSWEDCFAINNATNQVKYHLYGDSTSYADVTEFTGDAGAEMDYERNLLVMSTARNWQYIESSGPSSGADPASPANLLGLMDMLEDQALQAETGYDAMADIFQTFSQFDMNGDGIAEIRSMAPLDYMPVANAADKIVLVLVEARLLDQDSPAAGVDISEALWQYRTDLIAAGFEPRLIVADLYKGSLHQDGRIVLAIREMFRAVEGAYPGFEGAVLVGHFPDAYMLRRLAVMRNESLTINKGTPNEKSFTDVDFLKIEPIRTHKSDLILADLDGHWEDTYVQPSTALDYLKAIEPSQVGDDYFFDDFEQGTATYEDFFFVNESSWVWGFPKFTRTATLSHAIVQHLGDPEASDADKLMTNPQARPDIYVSRIDPWGVARSPNPAWVGNGGKTMLDAAGVPQTVTFDVKPGGSSYAFDPALERDLILEYFARNHTFRSAGNPAMLGMPAAIAYPEKDFGAAGELTYIKEAASSWLSPGLAVEDASLLDYVGWLNQAASLRAITAHANHDITAFGKDGFTAADLEWLAGPSWRWLWKERTFWTRSGFKTVFDLTPTHEKSVEHGRADFYLYRTLWGNGALSLAIPSIIYHRGCQVMSPANSTAKRYDHANYGLYNNAASLLFFAKGVAVVARAKVFNDRPAELPDELGAGATLGEAWAHYAAVEQTQDLEPVRRKKAYYWSVLGDWTVDFQ